MDNGEKGDHNRSILQWEKICQIFSGLINWDLPLHHFILNSIWKEHKIYN